MPPASAQNTESDVDVSDDDLVAGLQGLGDEGDDSEADADAGDADADADETADETENEGEEDADADDEESDEEDESEADDEDEDEEPAGLAQVRKAEQRMRAKLDAERADLDKAKAAHAQDVNAVQEFRELAKRARYDRVGVLMALGVTQDQFADISREFWAHSEEGAKDPKLKDAIAKTAKERAQADEIAELRKRLDEKDASEKEAAQKSMNARRAEAYIDSIAKAATTKVSPLAAHFLAKSPERTKMRLGEIAMAMMDETGEKPSRREVLAAYEKLRAAELRELDLDPKQYSKASPAAGAKGAPAKGAKAANGKGKPAAAKSADDDLSDDDLVKELSELRKREN